MISVNAMRIQFDNNLLKGVFYATQEHTKSSKKTNAPHVHQNVNLVFHRAHVSHVKRDIIYKIFNVFKFVEMVRNS